MQGDDDVETTVADLPRHAGVGHV